MTLRSIARRQQEVEIREAAFRASLISALRDVAGRYDTDLFVTPYNNPWREVRPSARGTAHYDEALAIVALARQCHGLEPPRVAVLALAAFESANDVSNRHRLGPRRLALRLLADLDEAST
jgi:hypothetical protein